jgi:hypothetical protein
MTLGFFGSIHGVQVEGSLAFDASWLDAIEQAAKIVAAMAVRMTGLFEFV